MAEPARRPGIAATAPGLDLAAQVAPGVPVTDPGRRRRRVAWLAAHPRVVTTAEHDPAVTLRAA
jgi:hypothetical protein